MASLKNFVRDPDPTQVETSIGVLHLWPERGTDANAFPSVAKGATPEMRIRHYLTRIASMATSDKPSYQEERISDTQAFALTERDTETIAAAYLETAEVQAAAKGSSPRGMIISRNEGEASTSYLAA